jgi:hypothetical protein
MAPYAEAEPKGKDLVVDEFKKVLTLYLGTIVYQDEPGAKEDETFVRAPCSSCCHCNSLEMILRSQTKKGFDLRVNPGLIFA